MILLFVVSGVATQGEVGSPFVKLGTVLTPEHPTCQSLLFFQQEIGNLSDSQMNIQIFPDAQLGTAYEILEGLRFGNIEMGVLPSDILTSLSPLISAVAMPYIFRNDDHKFHVLDGPVGVQLLGLLEKYNLVGLGFLDTDMKNLVTKQQHIKAPEDFQDMKIGRTSDYPEDDSQNLMLQLSVRTLTAMGAIVEPLSQEEVYKALQSENIDGWESSESNCISLKIFETGATYFTYSRHISIPDVLVVSRIWFDSLSPETQKAIQKAARLTIKRQRKLWANFVRDATTQLEDAGMKFETIDRESFYNAIQPVYAQIYEELGPGFEELIQAIIAVK
jgi:TRAP-type C4-dicarboxylate transport system substrate-binding protein